MVALATTASLVDIAVALKEELAWAIDKWLRVIINTMLSSTSDLQPSTVIANQSLGKSVSTYLNHNDATMYLYNIQFRGSPSSK